MSGIKKRKITRAATCCKYVKASRELPTADLPTYSDAVAYYNLIKERSNETLEQHIVVDEVVSQIILLFKKIGSNLPLIDEKSVKTKLIRYLSNYQALKKNKLSKKATKPFLNKLDVVFDIIRCNCPISLCEDFEGCDGCIYKAHIECKCRDDKIPLEDLHHV